MFQPEEGEPFTMPRYPGDRELHHFYIHVDVALAGLQDVLGRFQVWVARPEDVRPGAAVVQRSSHKEANMYLIKNLLSLACVTSYVPPMGVSVLYQQVDLLEKRQFRRLDKDSAPHGLGKLFWTGDGVSWWVNVRNQFFYAFLFDENGEFRMYKVPGHCEGPDGRLFVPSVRAEIRYCSYGQLDGRLPSFWQRGSISWSSCGLAFHLLSTVTAACGMWPPLPSRTCHFCRAVIAAGAASDRHHGCARQHF